MKTCFRLGLSFLSISLFACGGAPKAHIDESLFPFQDDGESVYLTRNGDNYTKNGLSYPYEKITHEGSFDAIDRHIKQGEASLLFLHAEGCASCSAAHDDLTHFFLTSGVYVEGFYFTSETRQAVLAELNRIPDVYPALSNVFTKTYYTPTMFILRDAEHAYPVSFQEQRESLQNLDDFLKSLMNLTYIYEFTNYAEFSSFIAEKDCLAALDDGDGHFSSSIYPRAIHKPLHTARIRLEETSGSDKESFLAFFGQGKNLARINGGKVTASYDIEKDADDAASFIESYYA